MGAHGARAIRAHRRRKVEAVDRLRELLRSVVFVQEVVRDLLEIRQVGVEECGAQTGEVAVLWVVDLHDPPWIASGADDLAAADVNLLFAADDSER